MILAAHASVSHGLDFARALAMVKKTGPARKKDLAAGNFSRKSSSSAPCRGNLKWPTSPSRRSSARPISPSSSATAWPPCFPGDYAPELGNTCPASIREAGLEDEFNEIIAAANRAYVELKKGSGAAADYVLTNSHRRPVLMKMNLREMYHFVRLRDDEHAQWDIRALAHALSEKVRTLMPLTAMMLCGKSRFAEEYEKIFAAPPGGEAGK